MTEVVNIRKSKYDIYIGRRGKGEDGYFGNPHPIGYCKVCNRVHDRADSINEFKKYFYDRIAKDKEFLQRVKELKDKKLGCFCAPAMCHGEVYKRFLDSCLCSILI